MPEEERTEVPELSAETLNQLFRSDKNAFEGWEPGSAYEEWYEGLSPEEQTLLEEDPRFGAWITEAVIETGALDIDKAKATLQDWIVRVTAALREERRQAALTRARADFSFYPWSFGARYNRRRTADAEPAGSYLLWQENAEGELEIIDALVERTSGAVPASTSVFASVTPLGNAQDVHWRGARTGISEGSGIVFAPITAGINGTAIVGTGIIDDPSGTVDRIALTPTEVEIRLTRGAFRTAFLPRARLLLQYKTQRLVLALTGDTTPPYRFTPANTAELGAFLAAWGNDPDVATTAVEMAIVDGGPDSHVDLDPASAQYFTTHGDQAQTPQIEWDQVVEITLNLTDADGNSIREVVAGIPIGKEVGVWRPGTAGEVNNVVAFKVLAEPVITEGGENDAGATVRFELERLAVLDTGLPDNIAPPTGVDYDVYFVVAALTGVGEGDLAGPAGDLPAHQRFHDG